MIDAHKRAVLEAWAANRKVMRLRKKRKVRESDLLASREFARAFGDLAAARRLLLNMVAAVVESNLRRARQELEDLSAHRQGVEWWDSYVEIPTEQAMIDTLAARIPPRKGETPEKHRARLWKAADTLRYRLGGVSRSARTKQGV